MLKSKKIVIITKFLLTVVFIISFTSMFNLNTFAHSGRTDSNGGHRDNKNASGLGSYHYHHGMGPHLHPNGVCPYASHQEISTPVITAINSVEIVPISTSLAIGDNKTLSTTITPVNATNKSITWSSSDTNVVTVNSSGVISAKNAGTAIIIAKTNNGKTDTISLTIDKPVETILINDKEITLQVGENKTLSATISPQDATNKSITWSSSDINVATISSEGVITAKNAGLTTIAAKTYNGKTHSITLSVNENKEPVSVKSSLNTEDKKPEEQKIAAIVGLGLIASLAAGVVHYKRNKK